MKLNIAFFIMNFSNGGGTERVTSVIANQLSQRDYNVHIISCQGEETVKFEITDNIHLFSIHGEKIINPIFRKLYVQKNLIEYVKSNHIEIVIAVDVTLYLYLAGLQITHICKCVAWEHFNYFIAPQKSVRFARWLAAKSADAVVVLGKNDLKNYKEHYKKIKNIQYIYNPIALSLMPVSSMKEKRAIAVGRFVQQKGFDLLIEAWKIVESSTSDWYLDIYGTGPMRDELQNMINSYQLKTVRLKGFADNIENEYLNSSLFLLSSRYEGFVLVLMEAQAKGLPCISFNCKEGPEEIITHGVNGYLVPNGDIEAFADYIIELIRDDQKRLYFSSNAQKDLDRFDINQIMEKWESLIKKLTQKL